MKTFVALLVVAFAASSLALTDEQKKLVAEHKKKCVTESGVAAEDLQNVAKGIFAAKPELHKFAFCFMRAADLIDDNANPKPDVIKAKLGADLSAQTIEKILNTCKNVESDSKEVKAGKFYKCYYENSDKKVLLA